MLPYPDMAMVTDIELQAPPCIGSYYGVQIDRGMTLAEMISVHLNENGVWEVAVVATNPPMFAQMANILGWENYFL